MIRPLTARIGSRWIFPQEDKKKSPLLRRKRGEGQITRFMPSALLAAEEICCGQPHLSVSVFWLADRPTRRAFSVILLTNGFCAAFVPAHSDGLAPEFHRASLNRGLTVATVEGWRADVKGKRRAEEFVQMFYGPSLRSAHRNKIIRHQPAKIPDEKKKQQECAAGNFKNPASFF